MHHDQLQTSLMSNGVKLHTTSNPTDVVTISLNDHRTTTWLLHQVLWASTKTIHEIFVDNLRFKFGEVTASEAVAVEDLVRRWIGP